MYINLIKNAVIWCEGSNLKLVLFTTTIIQNILKKHGSTTLFIVPKFNGYADLKF